MINFYNQMTRLHAALSSDNIQITEGKSTYEKGVFCTHLKTYLAKDADNIEGIKKIAQYKLLQVPLNEKHELLSLGKKHFAYQYMLIKDYLSEFLDVNNISVKKQGEKAWMENPNGTFSFNTQHLATNSTQLVKRTIIV